MVPALTAVDVSWSVADKQILSSVSFNLMPGKMLGLIGPNGAGKSSLLRCLYRYIHPDAGNICLYGTDIFSRPLKMFAREVAVVLQEIPLQTDVSVWQLVSTGLTPYKRLFERDSAEDNSAIAAALVQVGLGDKADAALQHLSGGEKQRALIARAIVQKPKLLLLDEPTNHLDIRYQIQILELVKSLGVTVIAAIHDLNLASAMCDELLLLNQGEVIAVGAVENVLTEQRLSEVFGVCCEITRHPQTAKPLIHYFYNYSPIVAGNNGVAQRQMGNAYAHK